jgi:hypothetical protein
MAEELSLFYVIIPLPFISLLRTEPIIKKGVKSKAAFANRNSYKDIVEITHFY